MAFWTDEELGILAERPDLSARELSKLMPRRTIQSINHKRSGNAKGITRSNPGWTVEEDDIIRQTACTLSTGQTSKLLIGRSAASVKHRRKRLALSAAPHWTALNPQMPAHRTLLAKTCLTCGKLMPGNRFSFLQKTKSRYGYCNFCSAERSGDARQQDPNKASAIQKKSRKRNPDRFFYNMRALTAPAATRSGYSYVEADFEVLEDPTLSILGKALRISRTYAATAQACHTRGFQSLKQVSSSREESQWIIDNPNAESVDEITAALKQEFAEANVPFPTWEWDWDDEDLNTETGVTP